jgi:hypothetical protein
MISQRLYLQAIITANGWLPLGTDFPVEDISLFKLFASRRSQRRQRGGTGYQMETFDAGKAFAATIWAAKST